MSLATLTKPLIDYLVADATLSSLCPGGVWLSVAPPTTEAGRRPVVVVSLQAGPLFGEAMQDTSARTFTYRVVVEALQEDITTVRNAAGRLDALLHGVAWDAGASWAVVRSVFVDVIEEAVPDGQFRLHRLGGVLEVWADHT